MLAAEIERARKELASYDEDLVVRRAELRQIEIARAFVAGGLAAIEAMAVR